MLLMGPYQFVSRTGRLERARNAALEKGTEHVRFEVFTAVTMKNGVFWDIETQFVPQRRHITSLIQSAAG
jgi:hypothetical protein